MERRTVRSGRAVLQMAAAAGEEEAGQATQVIEAVSGISKAEEEQNEVCGPILIGLQHIVPDNFWVLIGLAPNIPGGWV